MDAMRIKLLGNPNAGRHDGHCALASFQEVVRGWGWHADSESVRLDQAAVAARRATQADYDLVVVAGGDGTLRAAAGGLLGTTVPMLPLPCGTANDLARSLGLPLDPFEALAIARSGRRATIDVGLVNGHLFLNMVALGISARVSLEVEARIKERWGTFAYLAKAMEKSLQSAAFPLRLVIDGRVEELWAYQVSIANGCSFGGGWRISDACSLQEGLLDVVVIEPMSAGQLVRNLLRPAGGLAGNLATRAYRTPACQIHTAQPIPVNVDGDPIVLESPLDFQVLVRALTLMVPSTSGTRRWPAAG